MKYFTDSVSNQRVMVNLTNGPGLQSTLQFIDHKRDEITLIVPIQLVGLVRSVYNRLPRSALEMETLAKELIDL
jgi:hypothetical protein